MTLAILWRRGAPCLAAAGLCLAACEGRINLPNGSEATDAGGEVPYLPAPVSFQCDPDRDPSASSFTRLSSVQYLNTIRDLLASSLAASTADTVLTAITPTIAASIPVDVASEGFRRMSQVVSQGHVGGSYEVALAVRQQILGSTARRTAFFGACSTDASTSNDAQCMDDFIRRFGELALRRALSPQDVQFYRAAAGDLTSEGYGDLLTLFLTAPEFLYRIEAAGAPIGTRSDLYRLSAHELASRLSFHFWQSMPDEELFATARDGSLLTDAVYSAQVDRLANAVRTQRTMDEFFNDWLALDHLPVLEANVGRPRYDSFAGADAPTAALRSNAIEELLALTRHYTWNESTGSLRDLFVSDRSFASTADLARIYGVPAAASPTADVRFPKGERAGLITRAALLVGDTEKTHPILKGAFLRRQVLCTIPPDPPSTALDNLPVLNPSMSTRQRTEALTEAPGSVCASCHTRLLNPLGFPTEGFDSLGRARTEEKVFNEDGSVLASVPVNTASKPHLQANDEREVKGAVELSALLGDSQDVQGCFARQYFRFAYNRHEDLERDGCTLEALRVLLANGGSLKDFFKSIALQPQFKSRKL